MNDKDINNINSFDYAETEESMNLYQIQKELKYNNNNTISIDKDFYVSAN